MTLRDSIMFHIDKLVGTLKSEEQLKEVLKRKFTKKELKVFIAMEEKKDVATIAKLINDEEDRVEELYKSACKKIKSRKKSNKS